MSIRFRTPLALLIALTAILAACGGDSEDTPLGDEAPGDGGEPPVAVGARIAFVSSRDGNNEIYVMDADGGDPENLTNHPMWDSFPSWSPDGARIAFVSERDGARIAFSSERGGNREVYVMDADGGNPANLTNHPEWDALPSWSPDGARIAFSSFLPGTGEIYVMDADGGNPVNLTNHPDWDEAPTWSP